MGYTPLFFAPKVGALSNIIELVDHGAKVNHISTEIWSSQTKLKGKTPIFRARNFDTVRLLLEFGADPNIIATKITDVGEELKVTAIQHLLKYDVDCANAILDDSLAIEEDDLIFNFEVFKTRQEDKDSDLVILEKVEEHAPIQISKANDKLPLLLHPLLQIFLYLKFSSIKKVYRIQMLFQILMVASFTVITVNYVQLTSCSLDERNDNFTNQYGIDGVHMREKNNMTLTLDG